MYALKCYFNMLVCKKLYPFRIFGILPAMHAVHVPAVHKLQEEKVLSSKMTSISGLASHH